MKLDVHKINAFTDNLSGGNPACVVQLKEWLSDKQLLKIAKDNAVAETAFFIINKDDIFLRWFTPDIEMDLCGHATLATAHCLFSILNYHLKTITFKTLSGDLIVFYNEGMYYLDFPSRMPSEAKLPEIIKNSINILPRKVYKSRDFLLCYASQKDIENITIDKQVFDQINLDPGGVIVTAPGNDCDFVSRYFTPQATFLEDSVTGSAHCSLIPFWSSRLGKRRMQAKQISKRGGMLACELKNERVSIGGKAKTVATREIWIDE